MSYRGKSNFESFLEHISPNVALRFHDESEEAGEVRKPQVPLNDIWDLFERWSAFARGVPLKVNEPYHDTTQYYVPSLSAIQLFTNEPVVSGGSSSERSVGTDSHLYLEFIETMSFEKRPILIDKIDELAEEYPGLKTLTSSDLSENSWFSVSWAPIHQIPAVYNVKALSVSFLSYHSFTPTDPETTPEGFSETTFEGKTKVAFPAFGVVTSKLSDNRVWIMPGTADQQRINTHEESAASWLGSIMFKHSDFDMFMAEKSDGLPLPSGQ